jgi:hypothetical protein
MPSLLITRDREIKLTALGRGVEFVKESFHW